MSRCSICRDLAENARDNAGPIVLYHSHTGHQWSLATLCLVVDDRVLLVDSRGCVMDDSKHV